MNENTALRPNDVAKLMGHSQLLTTFHYSHQNMDKREETVTIFNGFSKVKFYLFVWVESKPLLKI